MPQTDIRRRVYSAGFCVLILILLLCPVRAADWTASISEDASGKKLTALSMTKPFCVLLTNNTDHKLALPRVRSLAQCLDLNFLFTTSSGKEIRVAIGSYSETWNETAPEVIGPGQSFVIDVDFTLGHWVHTKELEGRMKVVVNYDDRLSSLGWKQQVWMGKVESSPMDIGIKP